eukprot:TRINITY_DN1258_c0_g2_i1.p1 TRINITY_DN1258_c0_g2~~TRINITY_DN1258_c0_g2_i1.p1  ORF type:complete len:580 (+),score=139.77 TRINITY_DN1258_c0_g2_i1:89-1828(+)
MLYKMKKPNLPACKAHQNQRLTKFCKNTNCWSRICPKCAIESHKGHQVVEYTILSKEARNAKEKLLQARKGDLVSLKRILDTVNTLSTQLKEAEEQQKEDKKLAEAYLLSKIEKAAEESTSRLSQLSETLHKLRKSLKASHDTQEHELQKIPQLADAVMAQGTAEDLKTYFEMCQQGVKSNSEIFEYKRNATLVREAVQRFAEVKPFDFAFRLDEFITLPPMPEDSFNSERNFKATLSRTFTTAELQTYKNPSIAKGNKSTKHTRIKSSVPANLSKLPLTFKAAPHKPTTSRATFNKSKNGASNSKAAICKRGEKLRRVKKGLEEVREGLRRMKEKMQCKWTVGEVEEKLKVRKEDKRECKFYLVSLAESIVETTLRNRIAERKALDTAIGRLNSLSSTISNSLSKKANPSSMTPSHQRATSASIQDSEESVSLKQYENLLVRHNALYAGIKEFVSKFRDIKDGLKDVKLFVRMSLFDLLSKGLSISSNLLKESQSRKLMSLTDAEGEEQTLKASAENRVLCEDKEEELRDTEGVHNLLSSLDSKDTTKCCVPSNADNPNKENIEIHDAVNKLQDAKIQ